MFLANNWLVLPFPTTVPLTSNFDLEGRSCEHRKAFHFTRIFAADFLFHHTGDDNGENKAALVKPR